MPAYLRARPGGITLQVLVQPRASRSKIVGEHDGRLKIQLAAPPVDGEANAELQKLLSKLLGVPRGRIRLAQGERGRRKVVEIDGIDPAALLAAI